MSRVQRLTGDCEGCGRPDGVWQPHFETVYCPVCAAKNDDYDSARLHLFNLIRPLVAVWREHWVARGMSPDLLEELVDNTDELVETVKALNTRAEAETAPEGGRS